MGTSEIYRAVLALDEIVDAFVVGTPAALPDSCLTCSVCEHRVLPATASMRVFVIQKVPEIPASGFLTKGAV
ncbi:MAG: hypothetical protein AB7T48_09610 [Solirubrobacterales bacterium]